MARLTSPFYYDLSFDPFLYAEIGEERNGMMLSVLSALARLDIDPWTEAANLSRLPAPQATMRLTSLLSTTPNSQIKVPAPATIARLIGLLPKAARGEARPPGGAVANKLKLSLYRAIISNWRSS
jgi:hypothetical protein